VTDLFFLRWKGSRDVDGKEFGSAPNERDQNVDRVILVPSMQKVFFYVELVACSSFEG